jgi:hypothetical protein
MPPATSSFTGSAENNSFYYISHPYEGYKNGCNLLLGNMHQKQQVFNAYTYYLPLAVTKLLLEINEYFHMLIECGPVAVENQRRKSYLASIDTAIGVFTRIHYLNNMGHQIAVGSKYLKPITWAIFGEGEPIIKQYKYQFYTIDSIIGHYVQRYEEYTNCHPVCVYHAASGRDAVSAIVDRSKMFTPNAVVAGAIHLMHDMLEHGGPDMTDFFDLYTNDLMCPPDKIEVASWRTCRDKALYGSKQTRESTASTTVSTQAKKHTVYVPYQAKPMKIKVTITDEGDDLSSGCTRTNFQSIIITPPNNKYYNQFYY